MFGGIDCNIVVNVEGEWSTVYGGPWTCKGTVYYLQEKSPWGNPDKGGVGDLQL